MPPASKKDASVILFDLASGPIAKQVFIKICATTYISDNKDLTKLVLLNSNVTNNRLNAHYGGYEHINEIAPEPSLYNPKDLYEMIEKNQERGEANWLEGLLVALKNLEEDFQDILGIITYQVLFITDLKNPLGDFDRTIIDKIIRSINKLEIFLYVVGPDIEPPYPIKSPDCIKSWMKSLQVDANNRNLKILKEIISQTDHSVVCNYKMGIHLFYSYRNYPGSQPWKVPLSIGNRIQLPVETYKILDEESDCKLSQNEDTRKDQVFIDAEDETIEIQPDQVISGILRHGKFVEMPDNKMFQVENPRSFHVLCFTESVNVPEYIMRGEGCYQVIPASTAEHNEAFNILVDCLAKQKKYIIARRIYNNNFAPKIVALIPQPDSKPKSFTFTSLPFGESLTVNYREKSLETAPKVEPSKEIYEYLESIDVDNENSTKKLSLGIPMMQSISSQQVINKAIDKIFEKSLNMKDLDIDLKEVPVGSKFEALKGMWPERKYEQEPEPEKDSEDEAGEEFEW